MSFFGKNIKKIRGVKRLSQQAFADIFLLKRATLGAYEEGRSEPKIDTVIRVANYFSISIDDMLTKEITVNQLLSFNDGMTTDINQLVKSALVEVPFVNEMNIAEFISDSSKELTYVALPKISVSIKKQVGLLAFTVQDLVMVSNEEGLFPGDMVIGKEIDTALLEDGDVVIVLVRGIMLVRRYRKQGELIVLFADHINIEALVIDTEEQLYLWKVSAVMLKRYPNFKSRLEDRMDELDARLKQISKA